MVPGMNSKARLLPWAAGSTPSSGRGTRGGKEGGVWSTTQDCFPPVHHPHSSERSNRDVGSSESGSDVSAHTNLAILYPGIPAPVGHPSLSGGSTQLCAQHLTLGPRLRTVGTCSGSSKGAARCAASNPVDSGSCMLGVAHRVRFSLPEEEEGAGGLGRHCTEGDSNFTTPECHSTRSSAADIVPDVPTSRTTKPKYV